MKFKILAILIVSALITGCGSDNNNSKSTNTDSTSADTALDAKTRAIVNSMTLTQKIDYLRQIGENWIHANDELKIPNVVGRDSPNGIRIDQTIFGVQYPSQKVLASTWDIDLVKEYGARLGYETKSSGGELAIAPSLNMYRTPFGGRSSQYICGEDSFQCSYYAPAMVNGIQSQGILTSISHFIMNDQEANRKSVNIEVDDTTMREDYFLPFESAVKNSDPTSIMCAFTYVNGSIACESNYLITQVLKNDWGFKGFVASDYQTLTDAERGMIAGTDLDMGTGSIYTPDNISKLLSEKKITEEQIDDSVFRILRSVIKMNTIENTVPELNKSVGQALAQKIEEEGAILLKNDSNILPLNKDMKVAILGNGATAKPATTFGAAYLVPDTFVSNYDGLKNLLSDNVTYLSSYTPDSSLSKWQYLDNYGNAKNGVIAEYFNSGSTNGTPVTTRVEPGINLSYANFGNIGTNITESGSTTLTDLDLTSGKFAARFTSYIQPQYSGDYVFKIRGNGAYRVYVDDVKVLDKEFVSANDGLTNIHPSSVKVNLSSDKRQKVVFEFERRSGAWNADNIGGIQGFKVGFAPLFAIEDLSGYDAVIVDVQRGSEYEGESMDVPSYDLPEYQQDLIKNISTKYNNTIAMIHTGGTVNLSEFNDVTKAILFAGNSGEMQGTALARLLLGEVSPSGKLPFTIDKDIAENPTYASYSKPMDYLKTLSNPAKTVMQYLEGIYYGYKGYQRSNLKPLYPFGYGLSYTRFTYSDIKINTTVNGATVSFNITNSGEFTAKEIPQLYVANTEGIKFLKGFTKLEIAPGATKKVEIPLDYNSLASYDASNKVWTASRGTYQIYVGPNSNDLPLNTSYTLSKDYSVSVKDFNPLPKDLQNKVKM